MSKQSKTYAKRNALAEIAEAVIHQMETAGADWLKPWAAVTGAHGLPVNARGRQYTGLNRLYLGMMAATQGFTSNTFGTFKQWQTLGASVKKGSKGLPVVLYKTLEIKERDPATGAESLHTIPMLKHYVVFNASQVDGWDGGQLPEDEETPANNWEQHNSAEAVIRNTGATINHAKQDRAFYSPSADIIAMPERSQFNDAEAYYATLLHELTHWTGAKHRLNRDFSGRFGNEAYAFEELVAELGAAMLCVSTGVSVSPREDHAKYLNNWAQVIKKDNKAILKAASAAEKAAQFVLNHEATTAEAAA
jgi:antirestriction protein ArdC